ncbi:unnamed protein product [Durusdinium trenchii]|uniref:Phospholipid/glycerol acyltransferase domain-containing protein n=1 Tax=Durusdinium trenchii TaxID=1381693 RepID=A0ABP0RW96_9DINO
MTVLPQSHARRTERRKKRTPSSPSCQAEDEKCSEEAEAKPLVPLKPLSLNTVHVTSRLGLAGFMPTAALHLVASLAGLVPFSMGYAVAKMWSCAGGRLADSSSFRAGCYGFLYSAGIFPTVLHDQGGQLGPLDGDAVLRLTPLLVANHVSYLDALILPLVLKLPKFLSMSSVKSWPLFGSLGEDLEYIWVDRGQKGSRGAALEAIQKHVNSWKVGERPLVIFPEGTTSNGQSLYPFKQGAFITGAPVRPVLLKYSGSWDPAFTEFLMTDDAMNFWANLFHSCTVLVCEPYHPSMEEKADPELYASNVRAFMLEKQKELELVCRSSSSTQMNRVLMEWRRRLQLQRHWNRLAATPSGTRLRFRQKVRPRRRTALMDEAKEQEQIDHRCDPVADPSA